MEKIELEISGISYSYSQSGAYTLILSESGAERKLPIIIGQFEAQSIAIEMEQMKPARPLTHDLFKEFSKTFGVKLNEVIINKFLDGVFHSILVFEKENKIHQIDSRTSDAVALAIRFNCPIYTSEEILAEVGVVFDEGDFAMDDSIDSDDDLTAGDDDMKLFSLEELEDMLKEAVDMEDFEKASHLRDEINKRKDIS
jgi:hypothetical protein